MVRFGNRTIFYFSRTNKGAIIFGFNALGKTKNRKKKEIKLKVIVNENWRKAAPLRLTVNDFVYRKKEGKTEKKRRKINKYIRKEFFEGY